MDGTPVYGLFAIVGETSFIFWLLIKGRKLTIRSGQLASGDQQSEASSRRRNSRRRLLALYGNERPALS
ncbi:hypothetical protein J7E83_12615 [Arthrobacter sp. ISL-48]|uniref:hypothetical protein n=1 Tax=Arthrobacter sp. ISL-48 TaxID=2819110 RepID=UPI001BED14CB|nr:hypothetical protein [Arthrobacter sp. ISL-48]MBT2532947.1 hypothetical protein [Arthrobacter sp. ISL-48]